MDRQVSHLRFLSYGGQAGFSPPSPSPLLPRHRPEPLPKSAGTKNQEPLTALVPNRPGSAVVYPYKAAEYAAAGLPTQPIISREASIAWRPVHY